jgi:SAM-dependent methyltransferase
MHENSSKIRIIDFGSLDINGGPHRLLDLVSCEYIGVDLDEGPNVSLVSRAELVDFPTGTFDIAMSSELFEHAPLWREIFYNMCRLTRPGGVVVLSCAGRFRKEHGTTRSDHGYAAPFVVNQGVEYYRNVSAMDMKKAISLENWFEKYEIFENLKSQDTYFVGIRKGGIQFEVDIFASLIDSLRLRYSVPIYRSQILILRSFLFFKYSSLLLKYPILQRILNFVRRFAH